MDPVKKTNEKITGVVSSL